MSIEWLAFELGTYACDSPPPSSTFQKRPSDDGVLAKGTVSLEIFCSVKIGEREAISVSADSAFPLSIVVMMMNVYTM